MTDQVLEAPIPAAPPLSAGRRQVAAAVVGNALEFYDFIVYTTFAVQISRAFFPGHTPFWKLMLALVTFGVGFVTRPVGAIVIGRLGDRFGRRPAMLLSFALMGVGIVGLALTPSYAAIGLLAPFLVLVFRLIQGFALGGEVGPTTAFLVEAAPRGQRGLYGSWQGASQGIASLAGALVGVGIIASLGDAALQAWGWRLAIGLGAVILPVGYILRRTLVETRHGEEAASDFQPDKPDLLSHWRILSLGLGLIMSATIATYVFNYMATFSVNTLGLSTGVALGATVVVGATIFLGSLAGGALSDRFGRRPLMIWPRLIFIVIAVPAFQLIVWRRDAATLYLVLAILVFLNSMASAPAITAITECTRKEVRSIAVAGVYATAVAVFGGSAQAIVLGLGKLTNNPLVPAFYMAGASVIALAAALLMRESAPQPKGLPAAALAR
jgi:MHS family citrate/tricarballylate:H+ symporter-like MFS transporter